MRTAASRVADSAVTPTANLQVLWVCAKLLLQVMKLDGSQGWSIDQVLHVKRYISVNHIHNRLRLCV